MVAISESKPVTMCQPNGFGLVPSRRRNGIIMGINNFLVVGAGFFGSVIDSLPKNIVIIYRRPIDRLFNYIAQYFIYVTYHAISHHG